MNTPSDQEMPSSDLHDRISGSSEPTHSSASSTTFSATPTAPTSSTSSTSALAINRPWWIRFPLYLLAVLGAIFVLLVAYVLISNSREPVKVRIDAAPTIDFVMTRAYGPYSEAQRGWVYVGEDQRKFLMRVVQQAKPGDGALGDELYFVASGAPLDGAPGGVYGLFLVRADASKNDGSTIEISSPYHYDGDVPVRPEQIHFEALSDQVWAWVLKVQDGLDPKKSDVIVRNKVFAVHEQQVVLLAHFNSHLQRIPDMSCEEANLLYQSWYDEQNAPAPSRPIRQTEVNDPDGDGDDDEEEAGDEPPARCQNANWRYSTAPVTGNDLVPITVVAKGVIDGVDVEDRRWKLIFDPKSYTYIVPIELQVP